MALHFGSNQTPATGAQAVWMFLQTLLAASYTVESAGDGVANFSALNGAAVTGYGSGPFGLNNAGAWLRIKQPVVAGAREWVFQRDNTNHLKWRVLYSKAAGFSAGGNQNTFPTAADQKDILNESGAFDFLFEQVSQTRFQFAADADRFYSVGYTFGGGKVVHAFVMDPLQTGTMSGTDPDPVIFYCTGTTKTGPLPGMPLYLGNIMLTGFRTWAGGQWARTAPVLMFNFPEYSEAMIGFEALGGGPTAAQVLPAIGPVMTGPVDPFTVLSAFGFGSPGAQSLRFQALIDGLAIAAGNNDGFGNNPDDGKEYPLPVICGRTTAIERSSSMTLKGIPGPRGWAVMLTWATRAHRIGDPVTVAVANDYFAIGSVLLPCDPGTAIVV